MAKTTRGLPDQVPFNRARSTPAAKHSLIQARSCFARVTSRLTTTFPKRPGAVNPGFGEVSPGHSAVVQMLQVRQCDQGAFSMSLSNAQIRSISKRLAAASLASSDRLKRTAQDRFELPVAMARKRALSVIRRERSFARFQSWTIVFGSVASLRACRSSKRGRR